MSLRVPCWCRSTRSVRGSSPVTSAGAYDPSSGYQLAEPIGYSNALGLLTALAILLALGFAAHGAHLATRALAGVALVVLLPTLYFTFSRGALIALAGGAVVQAVLDPRRVRLLVSGLVVGVPAALGVLEASRSHALTADGATLQTAQAEGSSPHACARRPCARRGRGTGRPATSSQRRVRLPQRAGTVPGIRCRGDRGARRGGRAHRSRGAGHRRGTGCRFLHGAAPGRGGGDLQRAACVSGNGRGDYWHVAWKMARDEPLLGTGAGSFEAHWLRERPVSFSVPARDAHNLYLETLAELGPIGLALLLATLALPLTALPRGAPSSVRPGGRRGIRRLSPPRAAVDWDWEMPAVTLSALFCAARSARLAAPDDC